MKQSDLKKTRLGWKIPSEQMSLLVSYIQTMFRSCRTLWFIHRDDELRWFIQMTFRTLVTEQKSLLTTKFLSTPSYLQAQGHWPFYSTCLLTLIMIKSITKGRGCCVLKISLDYTTQLVVILYKHSYKHMWNLHSFEKLVLQKLKQDIEIADSYSKLDPITAEQQQNCPSLLLSQRCVLQQKYIINLNLLLHVYTQLWSRSVASLASAVELLQCVLNTCCFTLYHSTASSVAFPRLP